MSEPPKFFIMNLQARQNHLLKKLVTALQFTLVFIAGFSLMSFNYGVPDKTAGKDEATQDVKAAENNTTYHDAIFGHKKRSGKKGGHSCNANKKEPNIYSANPPKFKTKGDQYTFLMASRKKMKNNNNSVFSYTKKRYNISGTDPKAKEKGKDTENRGRQSKRFKK